MQEVKELQKKLQEARQKAKEEKKEYTKRLQNVLVKLPHAYATIIAFNYGIDKKRIYDVKNYRKKDLEVLEAMEKITQK